MTTRRRFTADFKAKVALEALREKLVKIGARVVTPHGPTAHFLMPSI